MAVRTTRLTAKSRWGHHRPGCASVFSASNTSPRRNDAKVTCPSEAVAASATDFDGLRDDGAREQLAQHHPTGRFSHCARARWARAVASTSQGGMELCGERGYWCDELDLGGRNFVAPIP